MLSVDNDWSLVIRAIVETSGESMVMLLDELMLSEVKFVERTIACKVSGCIVSIEMVRSVSAGMLMRLWRCESDVDDGSTVSSILERKWSVMCAVVGRCEVIISMSG